jgi:plastocyanin
MKKIEIIKIFCAGLIAAMFLFGCAKDVGTDGSISSQGVGDTTNTIGILSNSYSKPDHWVGRNYPVTWVNRDNKVHTVTADDGSWDSGPMQPGTSFTRAFSEIGSYSYHDAFSPARGVLNVFGRDP